MDSMDRSILMGMQMLVGDEWVLNQALVLEGGLIKAILPMSMVKHHMPATVYEYPDDYFLVPDLIDLHMHGAKGKDVMDADPDGLQTISTVLAAEGVTGFLATTMTADNVRIEAALKIVAAAGNQSKGAAILGVHLEGPFIAKEKLGAQQDARCDPDIELIQRWQNIAKNKIKMVTLAPELPGALLCIQALRGMGIVASIGHTNATYAQTHSAIMAGCSHATHLFNAMRGLHQREPGAAGALLLSEAVTAEIIADGEHLHPAVVDLCWRLKGCDRLVLVTDAMRAKCLGDGQYELGGNVVSVQNKKATLADGTLAGSTLRLPEAIKNMLQFTRCSLIEAVKMASLNPARVLGIDKSKGSIAVGKDADVAVMNASLDVVLTLKEGREIFKEDCVAFS